jgi:prepilin-type N-terminal cleavage/methylation domain-containing protein
MKTRKTSSASILLKQRERVNAFTLIELLVVIAIIAILASIALPAFSSVQQRAKQTKDLSNGKQVALALKQFALDNDGQFPNKVYGSGTPASDYASATTLAATSTSNDAFRWLLPTYVNSEDIFVVPGSAWCLAGADNVLDTAYGTASNPGTLRPPTAAGTGSECGYAYITNLNDTSNPQFPLLADGFSTTIPNYTKTQTDPGGVWSAQRAVVIFVDGSGKVMKVDDPTNLTVNRPAHPYSIFDNTQISTTDPWLSTVNFRLNPAP